MTLLVKIESYVLHAYCWHDIFCNKELKKTDKEEKLCKDFCGDLMLGVPPIEINKETAYYSTQGNSDTYFYMEVLDPRTMFVKENRDLFFKEEKAMIVFLNSSNELKDIDFVLVKVVITEGQTFWWNNAGKETLPVAVHVEIQVATFPLGGTSRQFKGPHGRRFDNDNQKAQTKGTAHSLNIIIHPHVHKIPPLTQNETTSILQFPDKTTEAVQLEKPKIITGIKFESCYFIEDVENQWRPGVAFSDQLMMYIVHVQKSYPWVICVRFSELLEEQIKVIISDREPTMHDFRKKYMYQVVGKDGKFDAYYSIARSRENETTDIYIGMVPKVSIKGAY